MKWVDDVALYMGGRSFTNPTLWKSQWREPIPTVLRWGDISVNTRARAVSVTAVQTSPVYQTYVIYNICIHSKQTSSLWLWRRWDIYVQE
jgi:hypothetical protein